ncbi:MAG: hypothetical protein GW946_02300 [Candidatus Pacebacteria bacterium]|nr:hypothetical protein [Candidatus Paceibacterota bacterium]PIR60391.1 MAG: hypothetical protein COU67_02445 [Candidatus Pacebacteria bacterium CG10_big_fil_rev_8_21_14_0_10_44_54]
MRTALSILLRPKYIFLSSLVAVAVTVFAAWLPNLHLVSSAAGSDSLTLLQKITLLSSLIGSLQTNFTMISRSLILITAVLAGVQISLLTYHMRQKIRVQKSLGMSFAGILSGLLGVGCASCGSVILTSLVGIGSTTAIIAFLPLKGQEFGLLGVGLLVFANVFLIKKISQPVICKI